MEFTQNLTNFSASDFINSLSKYLQVLCNGNIPFSQNVELIGHIYLKVDSETKYNYFLNESITKADTNATKFTSNSFHAEPQQKLFKKSAPDSQLSCVLKENDGPMKVRLSIPPSPKTVCLEAVPDAGLSPIVFSPKIINVQSVSQAEEESAVKVNPSSIEESMPKLRLENVVSLAKPSLNEDNPISEMLKNIKKEPVDNTETEATSVQTTESLPCVTELPSNPSGSKRKQKQITRVDNSYKKPRIIKPRASILRRKSNLVSEDSPAESGSIEGGIELLDSELLQSNEKQGVYPVTLLKNKNVVEKTGLADTAFVLKNLKSKADELSRKQPIQSATKRRGTYNFYSRKEKLQAIELSEKFGIAPICQRFGIPISTLSTWKRQFNSVDQAPNTNSSNESENERTDLSNEIDVDRDMTDGTASIV